VLAMGHAASLLADRVLGTPEGLPELLDVELVSPSVVRVLGQNPGRMTLQGTNTYIVGTDSERCIIDTSDGNASWWSLVQDVLKAGDAEVTEVLLTHAHYDHVGGIDAVKKAFPKAKIRKFFSPDGPDAIFCQPIHDDLSAWKLDVKMKQPLTKARHFKRCRCDGEVPPDTLQLQDQEVIEVGSTRIRVLQSPGHSEDSICLLLEKEKGLEAIFTGDTVLGGSSSVFEDLPSFRSSLSKLISLAHAQNGVLLLPGHGEKVKQPDSIEYLEVMARMQNKREAAIIRTLKEEPDISSSDLCSSMYGSAVAATLAQSLIDQHLQDLEVKGRVEKGKSWWQGTTWSLTEPQRLS